MLQQCSKYEAQLKQQLAAKGVVNPAIPATTELGWTGDLPHPMAWSCPADPQAMAEQAKQVTCEAAGMHRTGNFTTPTSCHWWFRSNQLRSKQPQLHSLFVTFCRVKSSCC